MQEYESPQKKNTQGEPHADPGFLPGGFFSTLAQEGGLREERQNLRQTLHLQVAEGVGIQREATRAAWMEDRQKSAGPLNVGYWV